VLSREGGVRPAPGRGVWGGYECGNRISCASFLRVCRINYGSILLSFRDMITGRTTDGRTDQRQPPTRVWSLRRTNESSWYLLRAGGVLSRGLDEVEKLVGRRSNLSGSTGSLLSWFSSIPVFWQRNITGSRSGWTSSKVGHRR